MTKIPALKGQSAQIIISEVGLDVGRWNTEKRFSSFLGLCPNNLITGGKILRRATRKVYNRATDTLGLCAQSLIHSKARWKPSTDGISNFFDGIARMRTLCSRIEGTRCSTKRHDLSTGLFSNWNA